MPKVAMCPACNRRISVNAEQCPKCGEPLKGDWAEVQIKKESRFIFWGTAIIFSIVFLPWACSKTDAANAQERLDRSCWSVGETKPSNCEGEVNTDLFPFCPSKDIYDQVKDLMPAQAARFGCETDVEGRMVKVLSCTFTTCEYNLYYGYNEWKTMWSQAGIVSK